MAEPAQATLEQVPPAEAAAPEADDTAAEPPAAMSLKEVKALIAEHHGVALGADDPVLMLVTLHQGFLADHERLIARHEKALAATLAETGEAVAAAVREALSVLRDEALKGSLENTLAAVRQQAEGSEAAYQRFRAAARRLTVALGLLAALTWLAGAAAVLAPAAALAQESKWIDPLTDVLDEVTAGLVTAGLIIVSIGIVGIGIWGPAPPGAWTSSGPPTWSSAAS